MAPQSVPDSVLDVGKAVPIPKLSARLNTFAWNDSDQDTDLEIERVYWKFSNFSDVFIIFILFSKFSMYPLLEENTIDRDTSGRNAYLEACELLGVVPARYFLAHLTDKAIVMRHHGLGPSGTQAIGKALRVSVTF